MYGKYFLYMKNIFYSMKNIFYTQKFFIIDFCSALGEAGGGGSPLLAALCHAPGELLLPPLQLLVAARARAETCASLLNKRTTWQELPSAEERKSGSHPNKISILGCSRILNICKKLQVISVTVIKGIQVALA